MPFVFKQRQINCVSLLWRFNEPEFVAYFYKYFSLTKNHTYDQYDALWFPKNKCKVCRSIVELYLLL